MKPLNHSYTEYRPYTPWVPLPRSMIEETAVSGFLPAVDVPVNGQRGDDSLCVQVIAW